MDKYKALHHYKKTTSFIASLLVYVFLTTIVFVFVYPFLYMFITSLKSYKDLFDISVNWIPKKLEFANYKVAAEQMNLPKTMLNSIGVTFLATLGHILSGSIIGYGFARFNFPFKNIMFIGTILSTIIPVQVFIVPLYVNYHNLNMLDTHLPFIIPAFLGFGLRGGIAVFLYRQYFYGFPTALEEAAMIDGCGRIKGFFKIALPSSGSITIVTAVLFMVWHWNDYYEPSLYLTKGSTVLVTQMLPKLYNMISATPGIVSATAEEIVKYHEGVVMAATAIAALPPLIAFFVMQRKFMAGIERTGLVG